MVDDQSPDEPFDPYAPPPPGQQGPPYGQAPQGPPYGQAPQGPPYGQAPQGPPYGQAPPGHGYYYPQGYHVPYGAPPKKSTKPLWLGAVLGLLLVGGAVYAGVALESDLFPWAVMGLLVVVIVLVVVPVTRRWGLGLLIGVFLSIPVGLIVFAGVCIVLIANLSQTGP
ncbi:hypothetical protein [Ornithinimicrobium murale]|uniref:hypothetical protein n=1 Tax=Ornithinimicrobium murale TaxID=1050153 RepID=UPI000E0D5A34|nr:hypothetical protein [Ornithinimicrobium murale]